MDLTKINRERTKEVEMWMKFPYWKNVHGIEKTQLHDRLYRIEAFDSFKENIVNNRLFFRHPSAWLKDDKLDSILLRLKVVLPDGTEVRQDYFQETFCQCWSTKDSKKMWVEYAKDESRRYIKMVANLDALMRAFDNTIEFKGYPISFQAGTVNYSNFNETNLPIRIKSQDEVSLFFNTEFTSRLYLEKRSSFDFENEVRFLNLNRKDRRGCDYAFVELKNPLSQVLDGIIIDSRMKEADKKEIELFSEKHGLAIIDNKILWD